jgi:hypothetical protein
MDGAIRSVKVFSATMARQRETLGERVNAWIREHADIRIIRTVVAQSSDMAFHCLSIILFCGEAAHANTAVDGDLPNRVSEQANGKPKRGRIEP